jgi:undecaprenyl-diphosphatase
VITTFLAAASTAVSTAVSPELPIWKAVILGLVEGITEFLPISSTGHLLIVGKLLGLGDAAQTTAFDAYLVVIQFGAIAAVLALYWRRVLSVLNGVIGKDAAGRKLLIALMIAFVPAAVIGKLGSGPIKDKLLKPWPVVIAWIIGGIVMLVLWPKLKERKGLALETITVKQAGIIGVAQALALWPGTSRSFVTILAGLVVGLSLAAAVEFSFLLGLLTLTAATAYSLLKDGSTMFDTYGTIAPLIGIVVAAISAFFAVKFMVAALNKGGLAPYGFYRIGAGVVTAGLILANVIK